MNNLNSSSNSNLSENIASLWQELRSKVTLNYSDEEINLLDSSFDLARKAHQGQTRKSGEEYIAHPIAVCSILHSINMDCIGICSAMMHDVVEDSDITTQDIQAATNASIAEIVAACTKLKGRTSDSKSPIAHYYRNIITKSGDDLRVIIVKLADRLHNMRTLAHMPKEKVARICLETEEIYAPLARRLGLYAIYTEMLDLSFQAKYPTRFNAINKDRESLLQERQAVINEWKQDIEEVFLRKNKNWSFVDMPRSNYAIYRRLKLVKRVGDAGLNVQSLVGGGQFALITQSADECFQAMGIIHNHPGFQHINDGFADFISMPKINGYQSLHTQVYDSEGNRVLFSIRTETMHERASLGVMSYPIEQLESSGVRELIALSQFDQTDALYMKELTTALNPLRVYVFDVNGKTVHLARGATVLDFAYAINVNDAHRVVSAKINDKPASLFAEPPNYSQIKLEYSNSVQVDYNRIKFVTTPRAINEIRKILQTIDNETKHQLGVNQLFIALENSNSINLEGVQRENFMQNNDIVKQCEELLRVAKLPNIETLIEQLSIGNRNSTIITEQIIQSKNELLTFDQGKQATLNTEGLAQYICPSCLPLPGEKIFGIFEDKSLQIHNKHCIKINQYDILPTEIVPLEWHERNSEKYLAWLRIETADRKGVLVKILNTIDNMGIDLKEVITQTDNDNAKFLIALTTKNYSEFQECIEAVENTPVNHVSRHFPEKNHEDH